MYFNLKSAQIYRAVYFYRVLPAGLLRLVKTLCFVVGGAALMAFGFSYLASELDAASWLVARRELFNGLVLIFLPAGFSVLFLEIFGESHLKQTKSRSNENVAEILDFDSANIFADALSISHLSGEEELSSRSLLFGALDSDALSEAFMRIGVNPKDVKDSIQKMEGLKSNSGRMIFFGGAAGLSNSLTKLIEEAEVFRQEHESDKITPFDILAALFNHDDIFKRLIVSIGLDQNDLKEIGLWYEKINGYREHVRRFWSMDSLIRKSPIGKDWTFGYAWHLENFAIDMSGNLELEALPFQLYSRDKEIRRMEQILARPGKNNVLLVGEEGVGKRNVVEDFVRLVNRGKTLPPLNYKKVFELNLSSVASEEPAKIQNILANVLSESVKAGNVILVIENFHNFIGAKDGIGRVDISEILVPFLKSGGVQLISTTNPADFHKFIESRGDVAQVFERVNVEETDIEQTIKIVQEAVPLVERRTGVLVTYGAIKAIVGGADKFIRSSPFPEKALDLLSETVSYAISNRQRVITVKEVNVVISQKTDIPLGPVAGEEKEKLANLEGLMHKKIVGQERAVEVVASTMRRLRAGLAKRGRPAGIFLFVGPTGVGKTLTSKILAEVYFGSKDKMIRFDMSEYQDVESLDRFLGSLRMNEPGQFVTQVRDNPFSLILLDELEKAHKDILNIFLQVFDEGRLTDAFGKKVSFEQNIIIATSNAGADFIRKQVKEGTDPSAEKEKVIEVLLGEGNFRPEFLNRFDEVVVFHPLSQEQVKQIAKLLLGELAGRLAEQGYEFKPSDVLADYLAKIGFDPQFGARPMQRAVQDKVENLIAKKILGGEIEKGKEFELEVAELQ
ncbi:MAG: ATP-dependent Clp protease ATP-binding subunit [bacterium]|nr:ATP-dependent Clp protease ATP-binding subunit [bacterium]